MVLDIMAQGPAKNLVKALRAHHPDCILLEMPADSESALEFIGANEFNTTSLPCLFMTLKTLVEPLTYLLPTFHQNGKLVCMPQSILFQSFQWTYLLDNN